MPDNTYASFDEVRSILTSLNITDTEAPMRDDDLGRADLMRYIKAVEQSIDSYLDAVYLLPISKVTNKHGENVYPDPLPNISARLCAEDIVINYFQDKDDVALIANAHVVGDRARTLLQNIITDVIRIPGQELKARSRFYNPYIAPQPLPGQSLNQPQSGTIWK